MSLASRHDRFRRRSDSDLELPDGDRCDGGENPKAVKTFIFEVTAGRPKGVGDATDAVAFRADRAPREEHVVPAPATVEADPAWTQPALQSQLSPPDVSKEPQPPASPVRRTRRGLKPQIVDERAAESRPATRTAKVVVRDPKPARRWPAWWASLALHLLLIAALTVVGVARLDSPAEIELSIGPEVFEEPELTDAEFASETQPDEPVEEAIAELIDPGAAALGMEAGDRSLGDLADVLALDGEAGSPLVSLGDAGSLFGNVGVGQAEFGSGLGASPITPQFFGAKIEGRRIVFVLDNSGSMQAGRLETVNAELERCVESLDPDQEFYVIFYSDVPYPLFYPTPVDRYVRPTPRNKELLHDWLASVELCLGDAVIDALNAAASIGPDTVILLSDGRVQGERKMAALLAGGGDFPLHTIGIGLSAGAVASRRNLADIAAANAGDFREAQVPAEMKELARKNPRPYHSDAPGAIWGRNVKGWGKR